MLPKSEKECDQTPDPIASGALPWLLEEFARIQDRYFARLHQRPAPANERSSLLGQFENQRL
jgi:hypothetical protein